MTNGSLEILSAENANEDFSLLSFLDDKKNLTTANLRELISLIEAELKASGEGIELPVNHHFSKDVYAREMIMPKGVLLVGKIHKYQNLNILASGEVSVLSVDGVKRVKAPYTFVATAGAKRVIYSHEDTVWVTIHGTGETDVDKIEEQFIAKNYEEVYLASDRSFESAISGFGFKAEEITAISENKTDLIELSLEGVTVLDSPIHGKGIFLTRAVKAGEIIGPARVGDKRTQVGRFVNHGANPNSKMVVNENGDIDLISILDIECGSELLTDYYFNYKNTRG